MDVAQPFANVCVSRNESWRKARVRREDFELHVERTKLEVGCRNVTHECANNRFVRPFRGQQICRAASVARRYFPPKIGFPRPAKDRG